MQILHVFMKCCFAAVARPCVLGAAVASSSAAAAALSSACVRAPAAVPRTIDVFSGWRSVECDEQKVKKKKK